MAEIVNLRRARKQKRRDVAAASAQANRLAFGRAKAERLESEANRDLSERRIDGHRREREDDA